MKQCIWKASILLTAFVPFLACTGKKDVEFCFSTIVNGTVDVGTAIIGHAHVPCGFLTTYNGPESNGAYDLENDSTLCGKSATSYQISPTDSAYFGWTVEYEGHAARPDLWERYEKKIALPPFPRIDPAYKYQVSFVIGYQDCVYCRIDPVPR